MSDFNFTAVTRTERGKAASRSLRREQKVPAIIYGAHLDPTCITLEHKSLSKAFASEAVFSKIVTIRIEGKSEEKAVIKAVERHHIKPMILHVDFQRVDPKEKIVMHVPIHFMGESAAPGVIAGGIVSHLLKDLEIKCLPAHLPQYVEIDVSTLGLDHSIHLADIKLPQGVEFATELTAEHNPTVVSIHRPRGAKEDAPTGATTENATTPAPDTTAK